METPAFFGFGSLVNRATHAYPNAQTARLSGWRREWVAPNFRKISFLSARRNQDCEIAGLMADVPGNDWAALDEREAYYARHPITLQTETGAAPAQVYAVEPQHIGGARNEAPILLSYLDVVLQGYLREFGEQGVGQFIATTDGWDLPVLDDRSAPIYPRAQQLSPAETALVDAHLVRLGCQIMPLGSLAL